MANIAVPSNAIKRRIENGVFLIERVHTVPANLAQNDTMDIPDIPDGARVLDIGISNSAAITSGTVNIGTPTDADYFGASVALATANQVAKGNLRLGFALDAGNTIRFTFNSTNTPAATNVITAYVLVSVDEALIDSEPKV